MPYLSVSPGLLPCNPPSLLCLPCLAVHVEGQEPLACDAVVCTLPLGVLQKERVAFHPPLPQYKRDAIKGLGMGTENRVAMLFEKVCSLLNAWLIGRVGLPLKSRVASKPPVMQDTVHKQYKVLLCFRAQRLSGPCIPPFNLQCFLYVTTMDKLSLR